VAANVNFNLGELSERGIGMAAASQILGWMQEVFDQKGIHYQLFEKDNVIKANFPLECKLKNFDAIYRKSRKAPVFRHGDIRRFF